MKKLLSVFIFCCFLILILFALLGGFEEQLALLLESRQNRSTYWVLSFTVLSSDIFIPVPSSLVMILNGKVLGFWAGTLLSTSSGLLSSAIGFYLGRKSGSYINRFFSGDQQRLSNHFFLKYGMLAIMLSKALPVISEAISFLSGTTEISFKKFLFFSLVGHLVISMIYAYLGSFSTTMDSNLLSAAVIFAVLLLFWVIDRIINRRILQKR